MVSALELSSRALLCRRFAEQEPANRVLLITEAEHCEQLSQRETSHRKTLSCRILLAQSGRSLSCFASLGMHAARY